MSTETLTALFNTRAEANDAALKLGELGVPAADVTISPETARDELTTRSTTEKGGFWGFIESVFGGDDYQSYAEGIRRGGTILTAHVAASQTDEAVAILEEHGSVDLDERESSWRQEGWDQTGRNPQGMVTGSAAPLASATDFAKAPAGGRDDVLQVVEEDLNVGKRAVNRGKVRIHSYVVERPVTENVTLHTETVAVERRPVDRPATAADLGADAFRDRVIEMDETHEEAVVSKTARVVEEVSLRKQANDRVETIEDTLRSTKVDVEDGRSVAGEKKNLVGVQTSNDALASNASDIHEEIEEDMEVVGSDGQHLGAVDHVDGDMIKLKKIDPAANGQHHLIPVTWVGAVDTRVMLTISANDAKARWTTAA